VSARCCGRVAGLTVALCRFQSSAKMPPAHVHAGATQQAVAAHSALPPLPVISWQDVAPQMRRSQSCGDVERVREAPSRSRRLAIERDAAQLLTEQAVTADALTAAVSGAPSHGEPVAAALTTRLGASSVPGAAALGHSAHRGFPVAARRCVCQPRAPLAHASVPAQRALCC
jgi:hypothetical protein